jgi:hypothetical protein
MGKKYYAGIGSRKTPGFILKQMTEIAEVLRDRGYTLRSGGADGADLAFETGALTDKEIWLPWPGFNGSNAKNYPTALFHDIASKYHPKWESLRNNARCLHARNVGQILGNDGTNISKFVLCWTPDGCINGNHTTKETGGTGQAIRIATAYHVPVINMKSPFWDTELHSILNSID